MKKKTTVNSLSITIHEAVIEEVSITRSGDIEARVGLLCNGKRLTSIGLSSRYNENDISHLRVPSNMNDIKERLFDAVKKEANISLEKVAKTLPEMAEIVE